MGRALTIWSSGFLVEGAQITVFSPLTNVNVGPVSFDRDESHRPSFAQE